MFVSKFKKWSAPQKRILASILAQQLFTYMCLSNMAPFFPLEASMKGVGESMVGLVFSASALTCTLLSPVVGRFVIPLMGRKFVLLSGSWIAGGSAVLFGLLEEIKTPDVFISMCFVVRIVEAVGVSMYITAGFSFLAQSFKRDLGFVMGLSEMSVGIGFLLGPTIGGALYQVGGFKLPFLVLGLALLSTIPVIMPLIPGDADGVEYEDLIVEIGDDRPKNIAPAIFINGKPFEDEKLVSDVSQQRWRMPSDDDDVDAAAFGATKNWNELSVRKESSIPGSARFVFCFFVGYIAVNAVTISFFETTLEPHLRPLGLGPSRVGYFFVISSVCYLSFGFLAGALADRFERNRLRITALGMAVQCGSFLVVGPSPLLGIDNHIWVNGVALALMGFSFAFALIPTFAILFDAYEGMRPETDSSDVDDDDVVMYSTVSGLWQSAYSFGEFIGPSVGGLLLDHFGYPFSSTIVACLCLISAVCVAVLDCAVKPRPRRGSPSSSSTSNLDDSGFEGDSSHRLLLTAPTTTSAVRPTAVYSRQRSKTETGPERRPLLFLSSAATVGRYGSVAAASAMLRRGDVRDGNGGRTRRVVAYGGCLRGPRYATVSI